jgi:hypothetical protein
LNSINSTSAQTLEKITVDIYKAQFIPISDNTNELEVLINYTTIDPSLVGSQINALMFVFAPDGTQIKTVSFPDGFSITESGTIFMPTKFTDESLSTLTVNVTLTDAAKTETISNTDTTTVPFNDEEGQESLWDTIIRESEEYNERLESNSSDREVERIESTPQSDLNISSATTYFEGNYFHIVGEVHNTDSEEKEFVEVIATLYDEDDNVIGTDNTFTRPSTISSQESAPFKLMIGQGDVSDINEIKSYRIITSDE